MDQNQFYPMHMVINELTHQNNMNNQINPDYNNNINNNMFIFNNQNNNQMPMQFQDDNQKQKTIRNFPPNNQYSINMNNMKSDSFSLLNKITSSIIIEAHPHPLYSCYVIRNQNFNCWTCNNCGNNYELNIPSFYCTYCDYNFCQNCLMQYPLYKIRFYDYSKNGDFNADMNQNNSNYYNFNIHKHSLAVIQMENYENNKYIIHCKACKGNIKSSDSFYYCTLCNFYVCANCINNSQKAQQVNQNQNSQNIFEQKGNIKQAFNQGNNNNIKNAFVNNNQFPNNSLNNVNFNNNNQFNMNNNYNYPINQVNQINQMNNNNNAQPPIGNEQRDLEFQNYIEGNRMNV